MPAAPAHILEEHQLPASPPRVGLRGAAGEPGRLSRSPGDSRCPLGDPTCHGAGPFFKANEQERQGKDAELPRKSTGPGRPRKAHPGLYTNARATCSVPRASPFFGKLIEICSF